VVVRMLGLEAVVPGCHDQNRKVARELTPPCAMRPGTQTQAPHGDAATILAARKLNQIASKRCPAGARHLGRHSNAELILESNDEDGPAAIPIRRSVAPPVLAVWTLGCRSMPRCNAQI
jgi:hypothetical protein